MVKEKSGEKCLPKKGDAGVSGGIYGLAFIGSLIYFLQNADGFWMGVLGILKAIVWPAIMAYKLFEFLYM